MIHYRYDSPYGDPVSEIIEMKRAEFQERFRPSQWTMSDLNGGNIATIPVGLDDINCDDCNLDPGDTIFVWMYGEGGCRAYCTSCWEENFKKHCTRLEDDHD